MPKPKDPFVAFVEETLAPLGNVRCRAMFGGWNVALDGVTFGLIADDLLYLKVDATNRPDFERDNLEPFVYLKDGQPMAMSYHRAPDVLDDWERIEPWVVGALEAAHRARANARPKSTRKKNTS
jgi:DNA transformation protein